MLLIDLDSGICTISRNFSAQSKFAVGVAATIRFLVFLRMVSTWFKLTINSVSRRDCCSRWRGDAAGKQGTEGGHDHWPWRRGHRGALANFPRTRHLHQGRGLIIATICNLRVWVGTWRDATHVCVGTYMTWRHALQARVLQDSVRLGGGSSTPESSPFLKTFRFQACLGCAELQHAKLDATRCCT